MKHVFTLTGLIIGIALSTHAFGADLPRKLSKSRQTETLIDRSPTIVRGKVVAQKTRAQQAPKGVPGTMQLIYTDAKIAVSDKIRGENLKGTLTVTYMGGCLEDKDLCMEVSGIQALKVGDERVFFLRTQKDGRLVPTIRNLSMQRIVDNRLEISNEDITQLKARFAKPPRR